MIAITIMAIITLVSYAPYNYYKKKMKLKNTASQITQILYDARNKAVNWTVWTNWNVSIGVYFNASTFENNQINMFSYPYNYDQNLISYIENNDIKKIKTFKLEKWIQIDSIEWWNNLLFYFNAITWKVSYYKWNWAVRSDVLDDKININISYKGSNSRNLNKEISYFTYTNVIDY